MRSTLNSLIESQMAASEQKSALESAKRKKRHLEDSLEDDSKSKKMRPDEGQ